MIRNDAQCFAAEQKLKELEATVLALEDPDDRAPYEDMAESIRSDITEYLGVKSGERTTFRPQSIDDLGEALVKLRISRGVSQAALAARLGVDQQQIQRWEARAYEQTKLWRMAEVVEALGYEADITLKPSGSLGIVAEAISGHFSFVSEMRPTDSILRQVAEAAVKVDPERIHAAFASFFENIDTEAEPEGVWERPSFHLEEA